MATILVSIALVVTVVAAFLRAPRSGQLLLAVAIVMVVFTVFELIAFACGAAFIKQSEPTCPTANTIHHRCSGEALVPTMEQSRVSHALARFERTIGVVVLHAFEGACCVQLSSPPA